MCVGGVYSVFFEQYRLSLLGGGGGGLKISNFNIFGVSRKMTIFWGLEIFWINFKGHL